MTKRDEKDIYMKFIRYILKNYIICFWCDKIVDEWTLVGEGDQMCFKCYKKVFEKEENKK